MVSLARSMLWYEWRRFLPAVFAVAFAGLLILIQFGLLLGLFRTVTVYIDRSSADLWVGFPNTQSIDLGRNIPSQYEVFLRMHPEVVRVEHFNWGLGDWRPPEGSPVGTVLIGVDTDADALTFSSLLSAGQRRLLAEPDTVLIDEADVSKLGSRIGDRVEINGKRVRVAGTVRGMRSIGGANVIMSRVTARRVDPSLRLTDSSTWMLVKVRQPERAAAIARELAPAGARHQYRVWLASDLSTQSQMYWLLESGTGAGFLFSSGLGLLVGVVITSQTLMGAVVAALREYAALRALGVSSARLGRVVIEQAAWVGLLGAILTVAGTAILVPLASSFYVSLDLPASSVVLTAGLLIVVAVASGLYALRALGRSDPAILLR